MRTTLARLTVLALFAPGPAHAQEHIPHPHPPILQPIVSAPDPITLSIAEEKILDSGKALVRHDRRTKAGSGVAIQDIEAPLDQVWAVILSHDRYGDWVKNVDHCRVYKRDGRLWYIDMLTSVWWFKSRMYMIHRIQRPMGYISWSLDRSRTSDIEDVVGYWRISKISINPPRTRIEYGSQLVAGGVPDFVISFLTRDSLLDGTAWVKNQSEAAWRKARLKAEAKD